MVAPEAKLNIIKDYQVVEKKIVEVPENVTGIVVCGNPKCITNHNEVTPKFKIIEKNPVALKCHYCEKITESDHMKYL